MTLIAFPTKYKFEKTLTNDILLFTQVISDRYKAINSRNFTQQQMGAIRGIPTRISLC